MHLYDAQVERFIPHATAGQIADILTHRFVQRIDHAPSESEVRSWKESLGAFADTVTDAGMDDAWIVLEYQLPLASTRADCLLIGSDAAGRPQTIVLEFKQWDRCIPSDIPEVVELGGALHLHPSAQARYYRQYLRDAHSAFVDGAIGLASAAYMHNARVKADTGFFDSRYRALLQDSPAYCIENVGELKDSLHARIGRGIDQTTIGKILYGRYQPSKQLLQHVADAIDTYEPWTLLDEQRVVFNDIFNAVEKARASDQKKVIIVKGGPGTGKSIIAIQVIGTAARKGYKVLHATGSKAFTINLRGIVGRDELFRYFMQLAEEDDDSIELLVCDEAHRLRSKSATRFRSYSDRPQAHDMIDVAKVAVFFLDGQQSVRADEIGSVWALQDYAESKGIDYEIYDLATQFRCAGSESYVRWIEYALGLTNTPAYAWNRNKEYDVRVYSDVSEMEAALLKKHEQGESARLVAGFCWEWSDPDTAGKLVPDVEIGSWKRPWNRKPREVWRNRTGSAEAPTDHPYKIWATEPAGFNEVGCIYSAQGFEFDYVGVIFGRDLMWDPARREWRANLSASKDRGAKQGLAKKPALAYEKLAHIYRVLSTRGMKGTYFHFLDEETRKHFEQLLP